MSKPALLLLVHRIPYPPNKGDKIRSYHLLRDLATQYRIFLGAFVDDENDWQYQTVLQDWCEAVHLLPLSPLKSKIRSLMGLLTGQPLSCPYYYQAAMQRWVNQVVSEAQVQHCVVYSSTMAQYVLNVPQLSTRVIDFVDVDSDKWRQYAPRCKFPMNWIYRRESQCLLAYETQVAAQSTQNFFVSEAEAALFKQLAPSVCDKVSHYANGVDSDYFDPAIDLTNPYSEHTGPLLVFTGAMDYFANEDAVVWMVKDVLPTLVQQHPELQFYIVGSRPSERVQQLAQHPNVRVTGRVDDVRGYVKFADCAVAPMQIARGIQNKVLEALSMATAVVCTPAAAEGLVDAPFLQHCTSQDSAQYAAIVSRLIHTKQEAKSVDYREYVLQHYSWSHHLKTVRAALKQHDTKI